MAESRNGRPQGESWIVGLQVELQVRSYRTEETFREAVRRAVAHAAQQFPQAFQDDQTPRLLIFPECLGAFLLFTVEPFEECFAAPTMLEAYLALAAGVGRKYRGRWEEMGNLLHEDRKALLPSLLEDLAELTREFKRLQTRERRAERRVKKLEAELQSLQEGAARGAQTEARAGDLERRIARGRAGLGALREEYGVLGMQLFRVLYTLYADELVDLFDRVLSELARETRSWVVAGSLYAPRIDQQEGRPRVVTAALKEEERYRKRVRQLVLQDLRGPDIYNLAPLYDPQGRFVTAFPKCFPTRDEIEEVGCAGVHPDEWKAVWAEGFGALGAIICADSWYPMMYDHARDQGVRVLAVPSYGGNRDSWDQPWNGYSGTGYIPIWDESVVQDVVDQKGITGGGAWVCFALTRQMPTEARLESLKSGDSGTEHLPEIGVNVFACGRLWSSRLGGRSVAVWFEKRADGTVDVESAFAPYVDEPAHVAIRLRDGDVVSRDGSRPRFVVNTRATWEQSAPDLAKVLSRVRR